MSEELLINVSPMESRVAIMNDGVLGEIYIERHNKMGLVGNIYVGTVVRVLPGMQAAFIDIGQSRTAFLHVNDMQKINRPMADSDTQSSLQSNLQVEPTVNEGKDTAEFNKATQPKVEENLNERMNEPLQDFAEVRYSTGREETEHQEIKHEPLLREEKTVQPEKTISFFAGAGFPKEEADSNEALATNITNNVTHNIINNNANNEAEQSESVVAFQTNTNQAFTAVQPTTSALTKQTDNWVEVTTPVTATDTQPAVVAKPVFEPKPIRSLATVRESLTPEDRKPQALKSAKTTPTTPSHELIQNRLHEGQKVLVQVTKDQLGTKGARLTTNISLPSRYLVYLPSSEHIGISQRIDNMDERTRLKTELGEIMQAVNLPGGIIARTAAEHISKEKLQEDVYYLLQLWRTVQARKQEAIHRQLPELIYQELSLPLRAIRDLVHDKTERVIVDDAQMYDYLRQFANEFVPMIYPRIVPHTSELALFDIHRVEEDLKGALNRRVDLKSGGYLIIDQTEAMTTIDVNTGSYVGGRSLEDTVYKTNLEATHTIARQLRLRNLGGIIILDFIDMQEEEHRDDVLSSLQMQLAQDYAKTNITQVSELGLVEMTRKRTRESLEQQLCEPCPTCQGRGFVKTPETVCFEIFREIVRCARTYNAPKQFTVVAHSAVIDLLLTSEADTVADLEYLVGRVITFEVEKLYTQEQYDIVLD